MTSLKCCPFQILGNSSFASKRKPPNKRPERPTDASPGQRPGYHGYVYQDALKGQKQSDFNLLLPFQGEIFNTPHFPRALPWAISLLAFQAVSTTVLVTCET